MVGPPSRNGHPWKVPSAGPPLAWRLLCTPRGPLPPPHPPLPQRPMMNQQRWLALGLLGNSREDMVHQGSQMPPIRVIFRPPSRTARRGGDTLLGGWGNGGPQSRRVSNRWHGDSEVSQVSNPHLPTPATRPCPDRLPLTDREARAQVAWMLWGKEE